MSFYKQKKQGLMGYLVRREYGVCGQRERCFNGFAHHFVEGAAALPTRNTPCNLPGQSRSTFLTVFSPDHTKVASTHGDHNIRVTEIKTGHCIHTLKGHPRTPWCIAFHPTIDGILASGCLGGEVHIWDLKGGGSEVWKSASSTIKGFVISSLTFHPTDQLLVIATNNTLLFWDWNRSEPFITMSTLSDVEKVRWVKFDSLGMNLYTGIANLPNSPDVPGIGEINEEMEEDTLLADRYRSVIDEISARSRRHDPIISLRPLSPTHADGLAGSLRYAESITQRARLANQQPQQQQQPQAPAQRMQMHAPVLPPPPPPPPLMTSRLPPHRLSATDFNYALPLDQLTTLNRSFHETEYRTPQVRLVPYGFSSVDSEDSNNDTRAPQSRNHPSSAQTVAAADVNAQSYRQGLLHTFHRARLQRSRRRLDINASLFNRTMHANRRPETETLAESQLNTTHNLHSRLEDMLREARNTYSGNPELSRANSEDDDMIMIHHHRQDSRSSSGDIFSSTVHSSNEASQSSDRIVTAQSFSDRSRETSRRENPASGLLNFFHQSRFGASQPSTASTLSSQPRTLSSLAASSAVTSTNSLLNAELYGSAVSPPWQTVQERSVTRVRNLNATSGVANRIQLPSQSTPMHAHRSSTDQHTERVHSPSIGTSNDQFHGHEAQIELVRNESHAPPIADTSTRRQLQFMRMLDQPEGNNEILPASYQLAIHNASTAFIEDGRWTGSTGDININRHDSLLITTAATATTNTTSTTTSALATNGSSSSGSSSGIISSNSNSSNSSSSASGRGSSSSRRDYVPALRNLCVTSCITSTSSTSSISQRNIHRTSTSMASDQPTTNLGYGDHNYGVESRSEGNRDQRGASTQSVADMRTVEQPQRLASILESEVRQALERVQERQQDIRDTLDALDRWRQTDNTSNRGFSTVSLNQMNERVERLLLRNRNRGASGAVRHQSSSPLYSGIQNNEQDEPTLGRASAAHESTTQISQQPAREQLNNNVSVTSSVPTSNPTTSLPQPMPSSSSQSEFLSDRLEHLNQINRQAAEVTQRLNRRMNSLAVMRANRATSVAGRWGGGGIGHHGRREYARYGSRHNQHEEIPEITITSPQGPMHRSMLDMTDPQGPTLQPTSGEMELNTDVMTAQSNSNRQTQPAHTTNAALEASLTQQQEHAAYPVPPSYGTVTQPISSAIPISRPTIPERPNIEPLVIQIPEMDAGNESSTSSFTVNADQPTGLVEQGSRNDESADIFSRDALQERTRRRRRRYVMRQREMLDRLDRSHASRANTNRRQSSAGNRLFGSHYIHPDYESSLLDNNANLQASQDTLQAVINRVLSSGYNAQPAVGSNIINFTHRIQCWDMSKLDLPKIHNRTANIVVPKCSIHNDASCDISSDGQLLAAFVPSHRGFPDATILGVFSLQPSTRGQCLYTKAFGPNAITVSISPLNNFVLVGLAARRLVYTLSSRQMVAQVFKMVKVDAGEDSMEHVSDMMHPCSTNVRTSYLSVNCASWLPSVGSGVVYGTNKGDLHICHPWHAETTSNLPLGIDVNLRRGPRYRGRRNAAAAGPMVQSTAATQTVQQRVRVTASTQTDGEELRNAA